MMADKHIKVLIVDDIVADARLSQLILMDSQGIGEVIIEQDFTQVMSYFEEEIGPAIILFDVGACEDSKLQKLRKLSEEVNAYLIATTGDSSKETVLEIFRAGAQDYLTKGLFSSNDLLLKVQIGLLKYKEIEQLAWVKKTGDFETWRYDKASKEIYFSNKNTILQFLAEEVADKDLFLEQMRDVLENFIVVKSSKKTIAFSLPEKEKYFLLNIDSSYKQEKSTGVKGIIQDISDRKKLEKQMDQSHQKYIDIFANSSDGIYLSSLLGHPKECNKSGLEIFGCSEEELLQSNIHRFFVGGESDEVLVDIASRKPVKNREIEIIQENGTRRNCLVSVVYFSDKTDVYTGIIRDITERKIAEKIQRTRVLEMESNHLKEEFIAGISHEMRTPMNAVVGLSNLLLDTDLDEEQRGYLKSIHYASEQLLGILNDILDISSLQNGKTIFEHKDFDIHDMLNNLIHNLSYNVIDKDVRLELAIDPELPKILKGDKLRINQILFNLAGNAVKFTDKGQVKVSCNLMGQSGDSILIKFAISDTGIGIPVKKQEAIFESFTRIQHKERSYEGTGLGLAISKNLIEQQGGKIWVKSTQGKGSTFFFDMVLEVGSEPKLIEKKKEVKTIIINPKRILIVEDNKMNQLVARKLLAKRWPEMEILLANNGQEALDIVDKKIDIVLMDLHMPVMDGYEATLGIRANPDPEISSLPILAMTADAQIQEGDKVKQHQLDGFIVKPFDPGLLYEKILLHLNQTIA